MLVARAPMRISFAGGGTDFSAYSEQYGGMVVSTSIDKYVYIIASPNGQDSLQISSSDYSTFFRHSGHGEVEAEGKLVYARAFLREFNIRSGYSIFIASEMPPGTGLGSSSSLAVALTKGFNALRNEVLPPGEVARRACEVEIDRLGMPIGKQDQYASAYGGLNAIYFNVHGVRVEPLEIATDTRDWLTRSVMLFFSQESRESRAILEEQTMRSQRNESDELKSLHAIKAHAIEARTALLDGRPWLLGDIMHRTWMQKKQLARGISNERIDHAYDAALAAGALGGKIAGAGGGGFLILVVDIDNQEPVSRAMAQEGFVRTDFHLDSSGARILVNNAAA